MMLQREDNFHHPIWPHNFNVMPFGLKNAPATFQRLMETVLGDLRGQNCLVYLDDIIIYSGLVSQHFKDLQRVWNKLTINLKKSRFCLQEIKFTVTGQGISADPDKVKAIQSYPVPTNHKEVQRFLGLAGWYHRFVPGFSKTAEPIKALKKKGKKIIWSLECQNAFDQLKTNLLLLLPILGNPNLHLPFTVYTDGSETGLGAVLTQKKDGSMEEVLAHASHTLIQAERNYSATEKECLAVVWALEKWQHYLEPKLFTIVTDHSALQWVLSSTKTTSRLIRWALRLQKFDFTVQYRKGKLNVVPDALARIPTCSECNLYSSKKDADALPMTLQLVWEEQHKEPKLENIFKTLAENDHTSEQNYIILEDKLYFRKQMTDNQCHYPLYILQSLVQTMLRAYHNSPLKLGSVMLFGNTLCYTG